MHPSICSVVFFLAICAPVSFAVELTGAKDVDITPELLLLQQEGSPLQPEQVAQVPLSEWNPVGAGSVQLGFEERPVWTRISLENSASSMTYVLVFRNPRLKDVQVFERKADGSWQTQRAGTAYPFSSREIMHPEPSFFLRIPQGTTKEFLFRIQNSGSLRFSAIVFDPIAFHYYAQHWTAYNFLLLGAFGAMALYNFFVFLSLRERGYLYLSTLIGIFFLFEMALNGTGHMYLWPNSPWWSDHSPTFLVLMAMTAAIVFTNSVVNASKLVPWLSRLLQTFGLITLMTALLSLTDFHIKYLISHSLGFIVPLLIMLVATRCWRKGYRPAGYFILAWGVGLLGSIMLSLLGPGLIPSNIFTEHMAEVGFMGAIFLWSFTLSERVVEKEEWERHKLQEVVARRTSELELTLADVRTLQSLLPICSGCKKIRDDSGYWSEVEEYFARHTGADFSHGLCPECAIRLYPQYFKPAEATPPRP